MSIATRAVAKKCAAHIEPPATQGTQRNLANRPVQRTIAESFLSYLEPFDYLFLAAMWALTIPVFRLARLPYSFDLAALTAAYWLMPVGAIFVAIVLAVLGLPLSATVVPFLRRLQNCKGLAAVLLCLAALLCWDMGPTLGIVVFVDALGLTELRQRCGMQFGPKLLDLLVPNLYLFLGLIAVFAFNHAIVGIRYAGTDDPTLSRLDYRIFDANVSSIAHWGYHHLPSWVFQAFDFVYFSIWSRFGTALVLVGVLGRRRDAVQFVRNILVCYALALMIFAAVPGKGPYSTLKVHVLPTDLGSYTTQQVLVERVKKLYAHTLTEDVRQVGIADYYISFPSLHSALPLIAIWFLRRWKRIQVISSTIYFVLLLPALVFLDWHYFVDIVGGWAVAILSIGITEAISMAPPVLWWENAVYRVAAAD